MEATEGVEVEGMMMETAVHFRDGEHVTARLEKKRWRNSRIKKSRCHIGFAGISSVERIFDISRLANPYERHDDGGGGRELSLFFFRYFHARFENSRLAV